MKRVRRGAQWGFGLAALTLVCLLLGVGVRFGQGLRTAPGSVWLAGAVTRVVDGDTLEIATSLSQRRWRLSDVDCPELQEPGGVEARAFVHRWVAAYGPYVRVRRDGTDRYRRNLGIVVAGGRNLSLDLVQAGLARPTRFRRRR